MPDNIIWFFVIAFVIVGSYSLLLWAGKRYGFEITALKIIANISWLIMVVAWLTVTYMILTSDPKPLGILFILFSGYCLLPIKQPHNYSSYKAWWADRKNWRKDYRS